MRKVLIALFLLSNLLASSQVLSDSVRPFNCYHDGAIFLETVPPSQASHWYFNDELLGWLDVDTMLDIQLSTNLDTLVTQRCGSYKVVVSGDTSFFYINCPLGSGGPHLNVKCFGDSTGILKRVAHSGEPPYFYEWFKDGFFYSSGYNDTLLENLTVGNYFVTITDAISCSDTVSSVISSPLPLIFDTIDINNINCMGVNSGNISFSISGGKKYTVGQQYDYYLTDLILGDTIAFVSRDSVSSNVSFLMSSYDLSFDSLFAGEYIVSVLDSFNCVLGDTFNLTEPLAYEVFASTTFPLICESDSGYLMIDTILGGGNINYGFNYNPIQGIYGDSLYVPSGWYQIFIEDLDFGCLDTVPVRCYAQYEINVFETISHVLCFGDMSGSIIIDSIVGGNLPYDIQWGGVDNYALGAGSYLLSVVDSIGCVHEEEYEILESEEINPNAQVYPSICDSITAGSISIDISGGVGLLNYYWLNGTGTPDSLYGLSDGIYTLVIIDSALCVDTFSFSLQNPETLQLSLVASDSNLICYGGVTLVDVVFSGGVSPYSIIWSDQDTNQQRVLGAGYYEVEIIDFNSCSVTESILITEPISPLTIQVDHNEISCTEGATATVNTSFGVPPISYIWNTGDTTITIDSLWELIYWVVVTDSCGNSVTDTVYLDYYELKTEVYYDDLTHTAEVNVVNDLTGPFSYSWENILGETIGYERVSPVLCEGIYFVTTTDLFNDCSVIDTVIVEFYLPLGIFDVTTTTVYADSSLWGFGPYDYLWSNGEVSQHADICPGNHWVEVRDIYDCLIREDFTVEPLVISLDPSSLIIECNLENTDLDLEASATGGIQPYTFEWWNGSTINPINLGLNPGDYGISVTDANNCTEDTSFTIATMTSACIPNVFTPDGDGINDTWSLEDTFLYEDSKVSIYGRFGKLVFRSVGYQKRWDGNNKQGNAVPAGAYFYSIEIGHGFQDINGTVTILR